ncbi:MAG: heavy metal-binding domain-containing protein [Candidatus Pacebacteria bacterium]|nr:heavy metal-binding domain-containing protein [Candidatus Paceibacterota bacterium]
MIITTTDNVQGKNTVETFGLVRGNTARSRNAGRDIMAFAKNITGGEVLEYTKLIAESRDQAIDRMTEQAEKMGANAICGVRFSSSNVASGVSEVLVYGTAVRVQ